VAKIRSAEEGTAAARCDNEPVSIPADSVTIFAVDGIPEIHPGDDLAVLLGDALAGRLADGDILVITSKVVSKAEGRIIEAADREDAITSETRRLVASRAGAHGTTRIVETHLGLVMAAAGVDASNVPDGTIALLPVDPDASALALATALRARLGVALGVIISDTFGRPWRDGQTDVAIGAAGLRVVDDLRGSTDTQGRALEVTVPAVADELAGAADLVKGKAAGRPVAVVRGLGRFVTGLDAVGAKRLIRVGELDMFRLGSDEAEHLGYERGRSESRTESYDEGYAAGFAEGQAEARSEFQRDSTDD
jgi:coenzyme F420-0:L-glutamate ligase/coenzyme F420-1:gamma-L-glutamate ligase